MCRNLSCRCSPASTKKRDEFSTSDSICYKCFSKMESKSIEEEQRIRVGIKAHKILLIQLHPTERLIRLFHFPEAPHFQVFPEVFICLYFTTYKQIMLYHNAPSILYHHIFMRNNIPTVHMLLLKTHYPDPSKYHFLCYSLRICLVLQL